MDASKQGGKDAHPSVATGRTLAAKPNRQSEMHIG
jgi:hypothetical protein